ncbi:MAG TPA: GNAT family N-acetyltransferase [Spirochaetales bacterium]|nr:GNAT family N-acetyltransferase [Spirochaetales bacterium]
MTGNVQGGVRQAVLADVLRIAAMRLAFIQQIKTLTSEKKSELLESQTEMFKKGIQDGSMLFWVYEYDNRIVGSAGLLLRETSRLDSDKALGKAPHAELFAVYTDSSFRRHGIGTALVKAALLEARMRGLDKVTLQPTDDSIDLYRSLGFCGDSAHMSLKT